MKPVLISIVVPVYNVEKYLIACLKSISSQSYPNYEVILVDDGSKDNSGEMCETFAKTDNRFRVIHKQNSGLGSTRNVGIENSQGDWITFVDSDDEIHPDYLSILLNAAESTNSEISVCDFREVWGESLLQYEIAHSPVQVLTVDESIGKMLSGKDVPFMIACAKLYKRVLFDDLKFKNMICEDTDMLSRLYPKVNSIAYVNNQLYYYFRRKGSISLSSSFRASQVMANWGIVNYYKENSPKYEVMAAMMCLRSLVKYYLECSDKDDPIRSRMDMIKDESWRIAFGNNPLSKEKLKMWCGINSPKLYKLLLKLKEKA